jgi:hypothetical protein
MAGEINLGLLARQKACDHKFVPMVSRPLKTLMTGLDGKQEVVDLVFTLRVQCVACGFAVDFPMPAVTIAPEDGN